MNGDWWFPLTHKPGIRGQALTRMKSNHPLTDIAPVIGANIPTLFVSQGTKLLGAVSFMIQLFV